MLEHAEERMGERALVDEAHGPAGERDRAQRPDHAAIPARGQHPRCVQVASIVAARGALRQDGSQTVQLPRRPVIRQRR